VPVESLSAGAQNTAEISKLARVTHQVMHRDPVCGMMVDERKAQFKSDHDGQTFYFCSSGCKTSFDKDPHRYVH